MATGRLGTNALPSGITTATTVYTVPTGNYAVVSVSFTNTTSSAVTIRLAMASTSSPSASEYIEYDTAIAPKGVLERTGLVLNAGLNIVAYASTTGINCNVYGIETATS